MTKDPAAHRADLADLLVQTSFEIVAIVTRVGSESDLSLTQVRMLGILRDRNLRMAQLAEYLGLERSTVSGLVDRAEKRGLVERRPAASDGRSIELRLTPAGLKFARAGAAVIAERIAPLVDRLPLALRPPG